MKDHAPRTPEARLAYIRVQEQIEAMPITDTPGDRYTRGSGPADEAAERFGPELARIRIEDAVKVSRESRAGRGGRKAPRSLRMTGAIAHR